MGTAGYYYIAICIYVVHCRVQHTLLKVAEVRILSAAAQFFTKAGIIYAEVIDSRIASTQQVQAERI